MAAWFSSSVLHLLLMESFHRQLDQLGCLTLTLHTSSSIYFCLPADTLWADYEVNECFFHFGSPTWRFPLGIHSVRMLSVILPQAPTLEHFFFKPLIYGVRHLQHAGRLYHACSLTTLLWKWWTGPTCSIRRVLDHTARNNTFSPGCVCRCGALLNPLHRRLVSLLLFPTLCCFTINFRFRQRNHLVKLEKDGGQR